MKNIINLEFQSSETYKNIGNAIFNLVSHSIDIALEEQKKELQRELIDRDSKLIAQAGKISHQRKEELELLLKIRFIIEDSAQHPVFIKELNERIKQLEAKQ